MQTEPPKLDDPKRKRRRFRFRLRSLMIVVTLLAIPCGYVGWQAKIVRERKAWLDARPEQVFVMAPYSVFARGDREQSPSHLRVWIGDERRDWIALSESASIAEKQLAASLFPEANVVEWPLEFSGSPWREFQKKLLP